MSLSHRITSYRCEFEVNISLKNWPQLANLPSGNFGNGEVLLLVDRDGSEEHWVLKQRFAE